MPPHINCHGSVTLALIFISYSLVWHHFTFAEIVFNIFIISSRQHLDLG